MTLTLLAPQRTLFKVHKNGSPLVWKVKGKHSVVSFDKPDHALYVATVTESHYKTHKEWPTSAEFSYTKEVLPIILGIDEVSYDELKQMCALWNLGLLVINDITCVNSQLFSFDGEVETFSTDNLTRIRHLNSLVWDKGFSK